MKASVVRDDDTLTKECCQFSYVARRSLSADEPPIDLRGDTHLGNGTLLIQFDVHENQGRVSPGPMIQAGYRQQHPKLID